jgi:hypothetical protein
LGAASLARRAFTRFAMLALIAVPAFAQVQRVTLTPQIAKLRPPTSDQMRALANIRAYSVAYIRNLPNFTCVQTTKRSAQAAALDAWPIRDEVRELVTFSGHSETYEVQSLNGKPVHMSRSALGGNVSSGEFGALLDRIFDSGSATEFGYERRTTIRGAAVDVFAYRVSPDHGYTLYSGRQKYESGWEGLIYADHASGAVLRIRMECIGIPMNFPVHHFHMTVEYGPSKIGDQEYFLPSHFDLTQESSGGVTVNHAEYGSYHKFETEASFSPVAP